MFTAVRTRANCIHDYNSHECAVLEFFFILFSYFSSACLGRSLLSLIQSGWGRLGKQLGNAIRTGQRTHQSAITFAVSC